jgi:hypothetical protein
MARYKAAAACWLQPDDHAGPCRIEPGEVFSYSGTPSVAMIPMDVAARAAKRRLLPAAWPATAQPRDTARTAVGLGASVNSTLVECRRTIEIFIQDNPITEESAA